MHPVVCKSYNVLFLTPTSSMEISNNKHFVSRCKIKFNELIDDFIILFDTGVIGEIFVNKKYAQQQRIFPNFLIRFIPLQNFDGNIIGKVFELFSEKKANILPAHRLYDHKIKFIKRKQPKYGFWYSMSEKKFQIWKKKSTKI